ncbi:hypothetical protein E1H13_22990 [Nodosilinea sp. P-1105]|nr:hypothetical protein [Nodosilinea sp. P-1105]
MLGECPGWLIVAIVLALKPLAVGAAGYGECRAPLGKFGRCGGGGSWDGWMGGWGDGGMGGWVDACPERSRRGWMGWGDVGADLCVCPGEKWGIGWG